MEDSMCVSKPLRRDAFAAYAHEAMGKVWPKVGNASSVHGLGRFSRRTLAAAQRQILAALGCEGWQLIWTGSLAEARSLAVYGTIFARGITFAHIACPGPKVIRPFCPAGVGVGICTRQGMPEWGDTGSAYASVPELYWTYDLADPTHRQGMGLKIRSLEASLSGKPPLWALELNAKSSRSGLAMGPDIWVLDSALLGGPKGVAAVGVRPQTPLAPLWYGGGQQGGVRPGSEPVVLAVGMAAAVEAWALELSNS